jgi:hypothetical protein cdivTM7_00881
MLGALLILSFAIFLAFFEPILATKKSANKENTKYDAEIKKLWTIAKDSMNSRKTLRAEKALLTILKLDETNAAAYNRLGILYAKAQNFDEAIECFEIAQSLDNNPMSLHNVGLIYLETGSYEKASMAFQQALKLDSTVAARFLALAKAEEKLGHKKDAIEALESAYNLDKSTTTLRQILSIYEEAGDQENIDITTARIEQQIAEDALKKAELEKVKKKEKKVKEPARVRPRPQPKIIYPRASAPINAIKKAAISSIRKNRINQESIKNKTAAVTNEINNTTLRRKKLSTTTSSPQQSNKRTRVIQ